MVTKIKNSIRNFRLLSPTSYMKSISEKVIKKSKRKIDKVNFKIPKISQYEGLQSNNYRCIQLKDICKYYKLKKSGNKEELVNRVYNYLRHSYYAIIIQKVWRGKLHRLYKDLHGPGLCDKGICTNESDFFTLESLYDIPYNQFFSYKDKDEHIYGFDIISLHNLINKTKKRPENPYNRNKIPKKEIINFYKFIFMTDVLNISINITINKDEDKLSTEKLLELEVLELFQAIDNLGNYTDAKWFMDLNRIELIRFLRELVDIWTYRAQITTDIQRNICPPTGNPFYNINFNMLAAVPLYKIRKAILIIMKDFVISGINQDNQNLGTSYVLMALTLVSHDAAIALPWLYQAAALFQ